MSDLMLLQGNVPEQAAVLPLPPEIEAAGEPSLRSRIEALLFASPTPLRVSDLCRLLDRSKHGIKKALDMLCADLATRDGALTVSQHNGFYSIVLKTDYQEIASLLMPPELEPAQLKTLSIVAIHQPLTQSRLVELRGSSAYEHVKALVEKGLVRKRREGQTYTLRTTKLFATRFRVEDDPEKIREAMSHFEQRAAELAAHGKERPPENDEFSAAPEMGAAVSEETIGMAEALLAPEVPAGETSPKPSIQATSELSSEPEAPAETAGPSPDEASSEKSGQ